jgi:hypothetical protein
MEIVLRLLEDTLNAGAIRTLTTTLPRAIYVTAGSVKIDELELASDNGTVTLDCPTIEAGPEGASLWRWEVARKSADIEEIGAETCLKMAAAIFDGDVTASHLLRLDSVAFPPGGCAYLHTHQGPGTRCLIEGRVRIDTDGHSVSYGPGSPWFEAGPEPVFAQADQEIPTRFIRALVLPKQLLGQSSIRYVNEADQAKPKTQSYRVFAEELLSG